MILTYLMLADISFVIKYYYINDDGKDEDEVMIVKRWR